MPTSNPIKTPSKEDSERLQKVLAAAGIASRRECEQWILDGRVAVDRKVVTELGVRVDPSSQEIRVDGAVIKIKRRVYFMLNKPVGVVCTNKDPEGRPRVIDLIQSNERLFPVGRLDRTTEGLILVTNDGELANQLAHPRFGVEKTYLATVAGRPSPHRLEQLKDGVFFADGKAKVVSAHVKKRLREQTVLEIVLNEGRNREIRRLLAKVGHKVLKLKRTAVGTIRMGDVPVGAYRELTRQELASLRRLVQPSARSKIKPARGSVRAKPKRGGSSRRKPQDQRKNKRTLDDNQAASSKSKTRRAARGSSPDAPSTGTIIGGEATPAKKKTSKRKSNASGRSFGGRKTSGGKAAQGRKSTRRKSGGK